MNTEPTLPLVVFDESPLIAWGISQYFKSSVKHLSIATHSTIAGLFEYGQQHGQPSVVVTGPSVLDQVAVQTVQQLVLQEPKSRWLAISGWDSGPESHALRMAGAHGVISHYASIERYARALNYLSRGVEWFVDAAPSPFDMAPSPADCVRAIQIPSTMTHHMTSRQEEVYRHVVNGLANKKIASKLGIQESTVKEHMTHIYCKLGVSSRTQAVAKHRLVAMSK